MSGSVPLNDQINDIDNEICKLLWNRMEDVKHKKCFFKWDLLISNKK